MCVCVCVCVSVCLCVCVSVCLCVCVSVLLSSYCGLSAELNDTGDIRWIRPHSNMKKIYSYTVAWRNTHMNAEWGGKSERDCPGVQVDMLL